MFVKKNRKNRTWFVGHRSAKNADKQVLGVFYSVPFKKAKKRSQLTIKVDGKRVDLNGRQVAVLREILEKGTEAKNWKTSEKFNDFLKRKVG